MDGQNNISRLLPHGQDIERSPEGHPLRRPALIATDLDGTIIPYRNTHTGVITERTAAALKTAKQAGIEVVLVTGRPMRWMAGLADTIGIQGPAICSNGAVILDMATDQIIEAHPMDPAVVHETHQVISSALPGASFGMETLEGFVMEPGFRDKTTAASRKARQNGGMGQAPPQSPGSVVEVIEYVSTAITSDTAVLKFMVKADDRSPGALLQEVRDAVGNTVSTTHSAPGMALVEISRTDVNKALTLADYTESLGVDANSVVAFGDQLNDLEMIRWAGTGYAVASGHPMLVKAADSVAGACDDDGVARVIEYLVQLPE